MPRICVVATGRTPGELMECAHRALRDSPLVELRLDWVPNPAEAIALVPRLLASASRSGRGRTVFLQATCRRTPNGGRFGGSVARQLSLLRRAAEAGCRLLDLEIESAESAGRAAVAALRQDAILILSFHDFHATPPLGPVARRLRRFAADYYKAVPTAVRLSDNCRILEFLSSRNQQTSERGKWIAFAMGEPGIPSRVLSLSRGGALVYAAPSER
ncbi:MAG TPA: type I 3-dehydroquinate dehydratase, partial [Terriglobia bacterium]|nr:type I 3-dehydroquinate dehydratase [Terriglobia bacterium]